MALVVSAGPMLCSPLLRRAPARPAPQMCRSRQWQYLRLDGSCSVKLRQRLVDQFNDPAHPSFLFLVSSKAGGVGLNIIGRVACSSLTTAACRTCVSACHPACGLLGGNYCGSGMTAGCCSCRRQPARAVRSRLEPGQRPAGAQRRCCLLCLSRRWLAAL
jgi:hypothetical protein